MAASNTTLSVTFSELFDIDEIQKLQDSFANALGVASIITDPEGKPLTEPSNFCELCIDLIRKTEKGLANCMKSDATVGKPNPDGPIISPCLSGGLWDAGASIMVDETHIASWIIGQVRDESVNSEKMMAYARDIGADEKNFRAALEKVTSMPSAQFEKVANTLFLMANMLSKAAFQNLKQRELTEKLEREIKEREKKLLEEEQKERAEKYMIFSAGNETYGIVASRVQEVIEKQKCTPIPQTPAFMSGVINLRGKIIPIVDFKTKLGLNAAAPNDRSCIIIVTSETLLMGLTVDAISGVANIRGKDIEQIPSSISNRKTGCIFGAAKEEERLRLLVNIDRFLDPAEMALLNGQYKAAS